MKNGKVNENKQQQELDSIFENTEPMGISFYRSYLEWFTQNELIRNVPTAPKVVKPQYDYVKHHESEKTKPESCENPSAQISAQMTISPPKMNSAE